MWKSGLVQRWETDLKTIDDFCSGDLDEVKSMVRDARRMHDGKKKKEVLAKAQEMLDEMMGVPQRWREMPGFYSDFEPYAQRIADARKMAEPEPPKKPGFAKAVLGVAVGFALMTAYYISTLEPSSKPAEDTQRFARSGWQHYLLGEYFQSNGNNQKALIEYRASKNSKE